MATDLATRLMRICSASTAAGSLWRSTRPCGPRARRAPRADRGQPPRLLRAVGQDLGVPGRFLKARPVAGDPEVGRAYCDAVQPMVWQASARDNFVDDVQEMRRRVERHIPLAEADRQPSWARGPEWTSSSRSSCCRLVHGWADETLRTGTTLEGLEALSGRLRRARGPRRRSARLPAAAHAGAPHPAPSAAPHAPHADVRGRPATARACAGPPLLARRASGGGAVAGPAARGAPAARADLLPAAALRGRPVVGLRGTPHAQGGAGAPVRVGPGTPAVRSATSRRSPTDQPTRSHPASAPAGHARLVRRRGRPGCRAARVPADQRGARLHPLVPPAAPGRGIGGGAAGSHPGPQPVRRRPAGTGSRVRAVPR